MKNYLLFFLAFYSPIIFGQVELFEKPLISNDEAFGIAISPKGDDLLYVNSFGGRDTLRIYHSKKINGKWQKPEPSFFSNDRFNQIDPSYSPDGENILINAYVSEAKRYDVYLLSKTFEGWSLPELLSDAINTEAHEFYATMALSKSIYFTRRNESNDIYVSYWQDGNYQKAVPLKGNINTENSESNPYISPKEDYLIFISTRDGGYGNADLYISFNKNNSWSTPINLGENINTKDSEFCPSSDYSNNRFFFARTIIKKEKRIENIFSVPMESLRINELRQQAKWD
tara:strand:+ start:123 stop:980 length:858 start_codon:yes stop_codon:yes gene_type:complete